MATPPSPLWQDTPTRSPSRPCSRRRFTKAVSCGVTAQVSNPVPVSVTLFGNRAWASTLRFPGSGVGLGPATGVLLGEGFAQRLGVRGGVTLETAWSAARRSHGSQALLQPFKIQERLRTQPRASQEHTALTWYRSLTPRPGRERLPRALSCHSFGRIQQGEGQGKDAVCE